jgi:hypothetical protein
MSEIITDLDGQNSVARPKNIVDSSHSAFGRRLITLLDEYKARMSVPSKDRQENLKRIQMLQNIVRAACPTSAVDMPTATELVRIFFDFMLENWGKTFDETTIFSMGEKLKATTAEADKITMFVTAFSQMVEGALEKKRILFVTSRLKQVMRNDNVNIALCRIRDNINKRNGF